METGAAIVRAPRFTDNRLADLDLATLSLEHEIAYLADAVQFWPAGHPLHSRFTFKRESLIRARDWIAGKVAAERAQRGDS